MVIFFFTPNSVAEALSLESESDLLTQTRGLECWINITFFYLKKSNLPFQIKLINYIPDEGLIVFHKGYFPKDIRPNSKQFFVCIQADYGRHRYAQMHIVQNPYQASSLFANKRLFSDFIFNFTSVDFISHWPQPCLKKRSESRNLIIENIHYFGNPQQTLPGINDLLTNYLQPLGISFNTKFKIEQWNNYESTDIVLSIRDFSKKPYYHKPLSKIINAVNAGSLVIAGNESGSIYFKNRYYPELPVVSSMKELLQNIDSLVQNSALSFEGIENAQKRIKPLLKDALINRWIQVLCKSLELYNCWIVTRQINRNAFYKLREI